MTDKTVNLNLDQAAPPALIHVTQGDTSWRWHFSLYLNGARWTIPTGATAILKGVKPDGHVFAYTASIASNEAVVDAQLQMTVCAGFVGCTLILIDAAYKRLHAAKITLLVAADPEGSVDVASDSALPAYAELLSEYAELGPKADAAMAAADEALVSAAAASQSATAASQSAAAASQSAAAAEIAAGHYPKIVNDTWRVWDPTAGAYVDTGIVAHGQDGQKGDTGKSAYQSAVDGGYTGTEAEFNEELADIPAAAAAAGTSAAAAAAAQAAAETAASHYPQIVNGTWRVWSAATGAYVDTGVSATGPQGIQGPVGPDGVSPAITVTDITGGHRVTITDAEHPTGQSFDVMDGAGAVSSVNGQTGTVVLSASDVNALPLAGGTMSGTINMDGNKVSNLPTPTASGDAVPKGYADGLLTPYRTSAAQDAIDANLMALGLTGASAGDLVRINTVDANGKPTSWRKAPLCEVKTNPNLLDNWYFVGGGSQQGGEQFPINQRGQTVYSGAGYGIDRWTNSNNSITSTNLQSNCLHLVHTGNEGYFIQRGLSKNLAGQETCLSILLEDGSLYSFSSIFPYANESNKTSPTYANKLKLALGNRSDGPSVFMVCIGENDIDIAAVKLELGSEQTLAHQENGVWVLNEIPDYREELAKCQRYYYKATFPRYATIGYCYQHTNWFDAELSLPVSMRTRTPTISQTGEIATVGNAGTFSHGTPTNVSATGTTAHIGYSASAAQTQGAGYYYPSQEGGLTFELSCDL